jgi:hypothetical protein
VAGAATDRANGIISIDRDQDITHTKDVAGTDHTNDQDYYIVATAWHVVAAVRTQRVTIVIRVQCDIAFVDDLE